MSENLRTPGESSPLAGVYTAPVTVFVTQGDTLLDTVAITGPLEMVESAYGARIVAREAVYSELGNIGPLGVDGGLVEIITAQAREQREDLERQAAELEDASTDAFNAGLAEMYAEEESGLVEDVSEDVGREEVEVLDDIEGADTPEAEVVEGATYLESLGDLLLSSTVEAVSEMVLVEDLETGETVPVDDTEAEPVLWVRQPEEGELDDLAHEEATRALGDLGLIRTVTVGNYVLDGEIVHEAHEQDLTSIEDRTIALLALLGLAQREATDEIVVGAMDEA